MALKRKRSSPTFSSPYSDSSTSIDSSSPNPMPFFYAQSKPTEPLHHKPTWSFPTYDSDESHGHGHSAPRHLNSRTRKRHRDNRPDEKSIFGALQSSCVAWLGAAHMGTFADVCRCAASTISRLYEAQRLHPKAEPVLSQSNVYGRIEEPAQKSTLHSFWKINAPAPSPATSVPMALDSVMNSAVCLESKCEDCEGPLREADAMDVDDLYLQQETSCASCRRQVCDRCAVLGNDRICLACASR